MIPGGLYLAVTSAIARVINPAVHRELDRLGRGGLLATCVTVDLEVLYSARTPAEHATTAARRAAGFVDLPLNAEIGARARVVQAMLAKRSQHRAAGLVDLLTAAVAEHYRAIVLHYDGDFEHIAAVTGQETQWVVPRGTADWPIDADHVSKLERGLSTWPNKRYREAFRVALDVGCDAELGFYHRRLRDTVDAGELTDGSWEVVGVRRSEFVRLVTGLGAGAGLGLGAALSDPVREVLSLAANPATAGRVGRFGGRSGPGGHSDVPLVAGAVWRRRVPGRPGRPGAVGGRAAGGSGRGRHPS